MARTVVYLRFPRNRNGFQDPPILEWNASKEKELWSMLKDTSTDLEWHELAKHFDVPLVYILQQAAWLYEKELGILRKRMSRISTSLTHDRLASSHEAESSYLNEIRQRLGSGSVHERAEAASHGTAHAMPHAMSPLDSLEGSTGSPQLGSFEEDDNDFSARRLLSTSRILASDDGSEFSDGSEFGILPANHTMDASTTSSESTVSQSALEAALIERSIHSETSDNL